MAVRKYEIGAITVAPLNAPSGSGVVPVPNGDVVSLAIAKKNRVGFFVLGGYLVDTIMSGQVAEEGVILRRDELGERERCHALRKAETFVAGNRNRHVSTRCVAKHVGCSAGHLSALFRKRRRTSLKKFIDNERSEFVKQYLLYSDLTISEIAVLAGFEDIYSFSRFFKRVTGMSPNAFRKAMEKR